MKIGLVIPEARPEALVYAKRAAAYLERRGAAALCEGNALPGLRAFSEEDRPDALLALGGDGTLLRCVRWAVACHAPLLGINLGSLGFLTEEEPEELEHAMDALLSGAYEVERRSLLKATLPDGVSYLALNDAVVSRSGYPRLIRVRTRVDGEIAGQYRADGLIVATPTGSTGYSLSAGGPIVSPQVDCMVITPVCAHSLQHRPLLVHGSAEVSLELYGGSGIRASLEIDGRTCAELVSGDEVSVRRAEENLELIHLHPPRFFELVHRKLSEWAT
ncbi:MAG: NAD(+)/NADH kinase [Clostridia bacterium]|nr:NAD(+)/NADH kinase [Clostridia bacterium]